MAENSQNLFKGRQYISVETYRKSGEAVRTPVWFAQEENRLYIWTYGASGKVKRARRCPQVKVAPSDMSGKPLDAYVTGEARIHPPHSEGFEHGSRLINRKYGLLKSLFELFGGSKKDANVILEITLQD
jgi:uncharacterized protein